MTKAKFALGLSALLFTTLIANAIEVQNLRCEYLVNPLGIDATIPRLSWTLESSRRNEEQMAYEVVVASTPEFLQQDRGDLWDSGRVDSDESLHIVYAGKPLVSRQRCFWKIRAWDRDGKPSAWSSAAQWQMGLLQPDDWSAKWITTEVSSSPSSGSLIIKRAAYGAADDNSHKADVTALLAALVKGNCLNMDVNNKNLGGDPVPNHRKQLRVEYELDGKAFTKVLDEDQTLSIPEERTDVRYMRKAFRLNSRVERATLYATALGLYEVQLNGQRVGDHVLAPDWTDYRKRVRYQAYDVTKMLKKGDNAIGAMIANGWFSGRIGNGAKQFYGKIPALLAQLEITYADGRTERIVSDASWKTHVGPIVATDFMLGETHDARLEIKGWSKAGVDESDWAPASTRDESSRTLEAQVMEPVRKIMELKTKKITEPKPGQWVFDLGQNMVGVVRLKVSAPAGTKITLRHAEVLNMDGTLYVTNLRGAPSVDHYICEGGGEETWQPSFTFHGFRYVEVTGLPKPPKESAVTGIVVSTDTRQTGEFSCSDPRINQLQSNIQWGQRGNYLSIPTDCPQRDERLGWLGDAEVFIRTAAYNADVAAFFTKWLVDVDDGQSPQGAYGDVSPNTMGGNGTPAWADAGVICPWTIYEMYGDKRVLEMHLPAMIKWIEFMREHSNQLIRDGDRGSDYGDWLSIGADTPKDLIGTAFFAYSTHLVARSCHVLGRETDAKKYRQLFSEIKKAFNEKYVAADGRIKGNTQCAYLMAIKFELLSDEMRAKAAERLVADILAKGDHLSTGFIGVGYLLPGLTEVGRSDLAYKLLLQDTFPSWLYSVKHGATTIWERWDGWTPEKGFQDPIMNSFNHYSLGSCGEYLFADVGGIRPASAGYKTILIKPVISDGLTWAKTSYDSICGKIATAWRRDGDQFTLNVLIPANTTAVVCIPTDDIKDLMEGRNPVKQSGGVKEVKIVDSLTKVQIGSGAYTFCWREK